MRLSSSDGLLKMSVRWASFGKGDWVLIPRGSDKEYVEKRHSAVDMGKRLNRIFEVRLMPCKGGDLLKIKRLI